MKDHKSYEQICHIVLFYLAQFQHLQVKAPIFFHFPKTLG